MVNADYKQTSQIFLGRKKDFENITVCRIRVITMLLMLLGPSLNQANHSIKLETSESGDICRDLKSHCRFLACAQHNRFNICSAVSL